MNLRSPTEEEEVKKKNEKIKDSAKFEAEVRLSLAKLKKEEEEKKKAEEDKKKSPLRDKRICNDSEKTYYIKFNYKCSSICGNKFYTLKKKEKYPFIYNNDIVIYDNYKHINHKRKAVILNYKLQGEEIKKNELNINKKKPVFDIKFLDDIDDLPFVKYEKDGKMVNTNKKIIVIRRVPYRNLKLDFSKNTSKYICIPKDKTVNSKDPKKYFNEILKKPYEKKVKKNAEFRFNKIVTEQFKNTKSKIIINSNPFLLKKNLKNIEKLIKKNKELIEKGPKDKLVNEHKKIYEETNKMEELKIFYNSQDIKSKIYFYFNNKSLKELIKNYVKDEKLMKGMETKSDDGNDRVETNIIMRKNASTNKNIVSVNKSIEEFNEKVIKRVEDHFSNEYIKLFGKSGIMDDEDKTFVKENIYNIVNKFRANRQRNEKLSEYTNKDFIFDEIRRILKKKLIIGSEFHPEEVFLKYANKELLELNEKEKQEEKKREMEKKEEEEKYFFKQTDFSDERKLVNPTNDRVFTLKSYDSILKNDSIVSDNEFENIISLDTTDEAMDTINVNFNIVLSVKDKNSDEILFDEEITKAPGFLNTIRNFILDIKENVKECKVSRKKLDEDIKEIMGTTD